MFKEKSVRGYNFEISRSNVEAVELDGSCNHYSKNFRLAPKPYLDARRLVTVSINV